MYLGCPPENCQFVEAEEHDIEEQPKNFAGVGYVESENWNTEIVLQNCTDSERFSNVTRETCDLAGKVIISSYHYILGNPITQIALKILCHR